MRAIVHFFQRLSGAFRPGVELIPEAFDFRCDMSGAELKLLKDRLASMYDELPVDAMLQILREGINSLDDRLNAYTAVAHLLALYHAHKIETDLIARSN